MESNTPHELNGALVLPAVEGSARGRAPTWDLGRLASRPCPACLSVNSIDVCVRPDGLRVVECTNCQTTYVSPAPVEPELERFYSSYGSFKGIAPSSSMNRWLDSVRPNAFVEMLEETGGLANLAICEVGCSFGGFLETCRSRGARPFGVEWDDDARKHLARRGIDCGTAMPPGRMFDIVCAFQLLEHLQSPSKLLAQMSSSLSNGGRLFISVPNGGDAINIGAPWIGYRLDLEHLNYFTIKGLAYSLSRHGLFVEHHWQHAQPALNLSKPRQIARMLRVLLCRSGGLSMDKGQYVLTVVARKVN